LCHLKASREGRSIFLSDIIVFIFEQRLQGMALKDGKNLGICDLGFSTFFGFKQKGSNPTEDQRNEAPVAILRKDSLGNIPFILFV
jgi:hypothetical protein